MIRGLLGKGLRCGTSVAVLLAVLAGTGCAAMYNRDYGRIPFQPAPYFHVQVLLPESDEHEILDVHSLLLLPLIGNITPDLGQTLWLAIWQEWQQVLPGRLRTPLEDGPYAPYMDYANIVQEDGRLHHADLQRIGHLARASHVLIMRVVDYRPYHPQRIIMEWSMLDVRTGRTVLQLAGCVDAMEQRVLISADKYLRDRRAVPYNTANLDVMLRSPRHYCAFTASLAIAAIRDHVRPGMSIVDPMEGRLERVSAPMEVAMPDRPAPVRPPPEPQQTPEPAPPREVEPVISPVPAPTADDSRSRHITTELPPPDLDVIFPGLEL